MQGGTKGDNAAGNDPALTPVPGEFKGNNVDNPLADDFKRGTVAMARTNAPNSATSAFFITLSSSSSVSQSLNGQYAAFGLVDESGMRIVNSIIRSHLKYATGDMGAIENPDDMPVIEYITIEINPDLQKRETFSKASSPHQDDANDRLRYDMKKFVRVLPRRLPFASCSAARLSHAVHLRALPRTPTPTRLRPKASGEYATGTHHAVVKGRGVRSVHHRNSTPITRRDRRELLRPHAQSGYYDVSSSTASSRGFCLQGTKGNSSAGNVRRPPIIGEFYGAMSTTRFADERVPGAGRSPWPARASILARRRPSSSRLRRRKTSRRVLTSQCTAIRQIDDADMQTVDAIVKDYLWYATGEMGAIN